MDLLEVEDVLGRLRRSLPRQVGRRAGVVLVAAVITVVFFVPLPHLSLFNRLSEGNRGVTSGGSQPVTTLVGWVPVAYGGAQISVPADWSVLYNAAGCERTSMPGEVIVDPTSVVCEIGASLPARAHEQANSPEERHHQGRSRARSVPPVRSSASSSFMSSSDRRKS